MWLRKPSAIGKHKKGTISVTETRKFDVQVAITAIRTKQHRQKKQLLRHSNAITEHKRFTGVKKILRKNQLNFTIRKENEVASAPLAGDRSNARYRFK